MLDELLKGKSIQDFGEAQLSRKAHHRWSRGDPGAAALLFEAAWVRAEEEGQRDAADAARNRHAVCLWEAGETATALACLEAVVVAYETHPERGYDAHFVEWAADCLLAHAAAEGRFCAAYREMQVRMATAGRDRFPSIHPKQDRIAEWAMAGDCPAVLREILPRIQARKPLKRPVRARIKVWTAWLEQR